MGTTAKKILTVFLFTAIILPAAMGFFCHCCEASVSDQAALRPVQDHSCCPDSNQLSSNCNLSAIHQAKFVAPSPVLSVSVFKKDLLYATSILLADSPAQNSAFQNDREFSPPLGFHTPLFLSLQILRL